MFKVGDWVRYKDTLDIFQIKKDTQAFMIENNEDIYEVCELWNPQVGEWCWVKGINTDVPQLAKILRKDFAYDRGQRFEVFLIDGKLACGEVLSHTCEPFIGQLPTFLKDCK